MNLLIVAAALSPFYYSASLKNTIKIKHNSQKIIYSSLNRKINSLSSFWLARPFFESDSSEVNMIQPLRDLTNFRPKKQRHLKTSKVRPDDDSFHVNRQSRSNRPRRAKGVYQHYTHRKYDQTADRKTYSFLKSHRKPRQWKNSSFFFSFQVQHQYHLLNYRKNVSSVGSSLGFYFPQNRRGALYSFFQDELLQVKFPLMKNSLHINGQDNEGYTSSGYDVGIYYEDYADNYFGPQSEEHFEEWQDEEVITEMFSQSVYHSTHPVSLTTIKNPSLNNESSASWFLISKELTSYKRWCSLPLDYYLLVSPADFLLQDYSDLNQREFHSFINYSSAAVDHPAYEAVLLNLYLLPKMYRRISRNQNQKSLTTISNYFKIKKSFYRKRSFRGQNPHLPLSRQPFSNLSNDSWSSYKELSRLEKEFEKKLLKKKTKQLNRDSDEYHLSLSQYLEENYSSYLDSTDWIYQQQDELFTSFYGVFFQNSETYSTHEWEEDDLDVMEPSSLVSCGNHYREINNLYWTSLFLPFKSDNLAHQKVIASQKGWNSSLYLTNEILDCTIKKETDISVPSVNDTMEEFHFEDLLLSWTSFCSYQEPDDYSDWYTDLYYIQNRMAEDPVEIHQQQGESDDEMEISSETALSRIPPLAIGLAVAGASAGNYSLLAQSARLSAGRLGSPDGYYQGRRFFSGDEIEMFHRKYKEYQLPWLRYRSQQRSRAIEEKEYRNKKFSYLLVDKKPEIGKKKRIFFFPPPSEQVEGVFLRDTGHLLSEKGEVQQMGDLALEKLIEDYETDEQIRLWALTEVYLNDNVAGWLMDY
ncbi:hypothetical protein EON73_00470 [bacterium]|nr:MAG: hypothetical protein EON73_00470 [bacterium]